MSYPVYPEYKDSGVDWLGEVPTHWELKRLRFIALLEAGQSPPAHAVHEGIEGLPFLQGNSDFGLLNPAPRQSCASAPKRALPGDILFSVRAPVGAMNFADQSYGIGRGLCAIRPRGVGRNYLFYLVWATREGLHSVATGSTYEAVSASQLGEHLGVVPPASEQEKIAAFLDHETARIDALVEEQQRLIALLKEKRQAVVSHAVTKGLDPNVPMKDSGVEWLGEVPKHWDVLRIGSVYVEAAEKGLPELPVLRVSIHHGVSDRELNEEESDRKVTRIEDREKYKRVRHGDLVYNMMRAWQGGFGAVLVDGLVSPAYVVARPKLDDMSEFIEQLLRTANAVEEMRSRSYGITDFRLRLYWENFKNLKIALPPREERQEIVNWLQKIIIKSRALESEAGNNISFLEERRSALISAAVTGKIDVRGWKPPTDSVVSTEAKPMEAV